MTFFFSSGLLPAQKTFGSGRKTNALKHRKTTSDPVPNNYYSRNKKIRKGRNNALPEVFIPQPSKRTQKFIITYLYSIIIVNVSEYFLKKLLSTDIF